MYCFENDHNWARRGPSTAFNAAGALQKCGDGDKARRCFGSERYKRRGRPKAAQTAQEHAEADAKPRAEPRFWTEVLF